MDQDVVKAVSKAVKAAKKDVDAAVAQLFAAYDPDTVIDALKQVSQEVQLQATERHADWAEYKVEHHPHEEYLEHQADYLAWKASANRFREGINSALRCAKTLRAEIGYRSAQVFYNGFLPEIADPDDLGRVSGTGC